MMRVSVLSGRGVRNGQRSGLTSSGNFPEVGSDIVCRTAALGLLESWGIRKPWVLMGTKPSALSPHLSTCFCNSFTHP